MSIAKSVDIKEGQVWSGASTNRWGGKGAVEHRKITDYDQWATSTVLYYEVVWTTKPNRGGIAGSMTLKSFHKWADSQVLAKVLPQPIDNVSFGKRFRDLLHTPPEFPAGIRFSMFEDLEVGDTFWVSSDEDAPSALIKWTADSVWDFDNQEVLTCDEVGVSDDTYVLVLTS